MKNSILLMVILSALLSGQGDHLIFSRIVLTPDEAEMVAITNPKDIAINLSNYYLTDATDSPDNYYYNLTIGSNYWSEDIRDFIVNFPDTTIGAGDTLLIAMNTSEEFLEYYGYSPHLALGNSDFPDELDEESTIGAGAEHTSVGMLSDNQETLILFYWDGISSTVQDVDYFLWSGENYDSEYTHPMAINKDGVEDYLPDTPVEQQSYIRYHGEDYSFVRVSVEETGENDTGGNGIIGHDETSEDFLQSWQITSLFIYGCTDPEAVNYNPDATIDDGTCCSGTVMNDGGCCNGQISEDGSCITSIHEIIHNCGDEMGEQLECDGEYDLSDESAAECPLYEEQVTTTGVIVDYFDITSFGGPHSFTIQDGNGDQIDFVVWPESSQYQDGFDITQSDLNILTQSPYGQYQVEITGELGAYCDDNELLDINTEWQVTVEYEIDITIIEYEIVFSEQLVFEVAPYPFIPSRGEKIKYTYSVPNGYRCIIRVFDLSGRWITTLLDEIPTFIIEPIKTEFWDGRTHLSELVMPGTYIMHLEATEFNSGNSQTAVVPVVVGARLK